ncbi:hypothetical protein DPMN_005508 [Dreissena polymorpha]|uniref:Transporter n=1 Tax=Dreissena polymorpha TaxID=45954 RepID=A0A9D4RWW8_DREPO|nr:hypothetical protein DPMN_005508 [Dreissena polymorpha]
MQGIWIFSLVQYTPFSMAGYEYPGWAIGLGWFLAALSIVCIPAGMIHAVLNSKGQSLWQVGGNIHEIHVCYLKACCNYIPCYL